MMTEYTWTIPAVITFILFSLWYLFSYWAHKEGICIYCETNHDAVARALTFLLVIILSLVSWLTWAIWIC